MNYKLKNVNGKVTFLCRTGKDLVRHQMLITAAQQIINNGKLKRSDIKGYPINVDDQWYFEGEYSKKSTSSANNKEDEK